MRIVILRTILLLILIGVFSITATSQSQSETDSILNIVQKQKVYVEKIETLQNYIESIQNSQFDATIFLAKKGYELAQKQGDKIHEGDFLRLVGFALAKQGNIDSATVYYYDALAILEGVNNSEKLGLLYNDIARLHRKINHPQRALEFYDKALDLYERENNSEGIARINNESGVVFRDFLNDYQTAKQRFEKSLMIQRERKDSVGIGYALEFLGYNELLKKDYAKAETYLLEALHIREKLTDEFAIMLNYTALGELYKANKQYEESIRYFEKSNVLAKKIDYLDIQMYNYGKIMENYEDLGDYKKAYLNLKSFNTLNDSLYNVQKLKAVEDITIKYETTEKEKEIAEQKLSLKNKSLWIFGLAALAIIMGLIGFILHKQQKLKHLKQQRDHELKLALEKLESQKKLETQRLSIARDLHDNIGAQLSFIISAIDTIKYYISNKNENINERLNTIGDFTRETIQELRDTIWAMNKSNITISDVQNRTTNFIEKARSANQTIIIKLNIDKDIPLDTTYSGIYGLNIFRIIQEATNNAFKYAEAQQIDIHFQKKEDRILFEVIDDGKGFDNEQIEKGNGILNMQKRALELGDQLVIQSSEDKGTRISFSVEINTT